MHREDPYPEGSRISVYRVVRPLEVGGMGAVYDVEDTTVGKRYVLKTLHVDHAGREDLVARMAKEARTLARLSHPNIVDVVTAGVTDDALHLPYFVMERLKGRSLRHVLASRGALSLEASLSLAIDLLDALDHAHSLEIVHRDVKPENVFLAWTRRGTVTTKLLDFGVMRVMTETSMLTAGRFVGTMRYASPEQLLGHVVGPASDVYAAALVLYEMLAGRGPFDGEARESQGVAEARLWTKARRLLPEVRVPKALDDLVASALEMDPALRPRDAFTFAARLREHRKRVKGDDSPTQQTTVELLVAPVDEAAPVVQDTEPGPPPEPLSQRPIEPPPAFAHLPPPPLAGPPAAPAPPPAPHPPVERRTAAEAPAARLLARRSARVKRVGLVLLALILGLSAVPLTAAAAIGLRNARAQPEAHPRRTARVTTRALARAAAKVYLEPKDAVAAPPPSPARVVRWVPDDGRELLQR